MFASEKKIFSFSTILESRASIIFAFNVFLSSGTSYLPKKVFISLVATVLMFFLFADKGNVPRSIMKLLRTCFYGSPAVK